MRRISGILFGIISLLVIGYLLFAVVPKDTQDSDPEVTDSETEIEITEPDDIALHIQSKQDLIRVETPTRGTAISSPLTVTGEARGYWFFEASFPITVTDWNGLIIGEGYAMATEEWMTEGFVPFVGEITFTVPTETPYRRGIIIFAKDNPSDLPEYDDALEIPILFE